MKIYNSRKSLQDAVWHSLRNDEIKDFRRDLDKALEEADRITGIGHFEGKYWAERAISGLVALGCSLVLVHVHDSKPFYSVKWAV